MLLLSLLLVLSIIIIIIIINIIRSSSSRCNVSRVGGLVWVGLVWCCGVLVCVGLVLRACRRVTYWFCKHSPYTASKSPSQPGGVPAPLHKISISISIIIMIIVIISSRSSSSSSSRSSSSSSSSSMCNIIPYWASLDCNKVCCHVASCCIASCCAVVYFTFQFYKALCLCLPVKLSVFIELIVVPCCGVLLCVGLV